MTDILKIPCTSTRDIVPIKITLDVLTIQIIQCFAEYHPKPVRYYIKLTDGEKYQITGKVFLQLIERLSDHPKKASIKTKST